MEGLSIRHGARIFPGMIYIAEEPEDAGLDEDFPLGDGTADTSAEVTCPYCGETMDIALDPGSGTRQEYVEDCQVCCRPWNVSVTYGPDGEATVEAEASDGGWDD
jgi:Cysteine-rich CPXCG